MFLNNQQVTEEIKKEIKKFLEINDNENMITQNLWHAAKAVLRGKFIAILPQERRKRSNRQPNFHLKQLEKEEIRFVFYTLKILTKFAVSKQILRLYETNNISFRNPVHTGNRVCPFPGVSAKFHPPF